MTTIKKAAEEWRTSQNAQDIANHYERFCKLYLGQQKTFQAHIDGQSSGFKTGATWALEEVLREAEKVNSFASFGPLHTAAVSLYDLKQIIEKLRVG